ncbi:hypothetical protein HK101_006548 [Irineochytrium annulatum]|nr:hypothetical protein HK101_006548 [Irineochytrium annulatum]
MRSRADTVEGEVKVETVEAEVPKEVKKAQEAPIKHALIVEDNVINQKLLQHYLHKLGVSSTVAGDGVEALEVLSDPKVCSRVDMIFMDVTMPRLDGIECTRAIRRLEDVAASSLSERMRKRGGRRVTIAAVTGNATRESEEVGMKAGMDHYLHKPWSRSEIARVCGFVEAA